MRTIVYLFITFLLLPLPAHAGYKIFATFNGAADGVDPVGGLIMDSSGNFYGVTKFGGSSNEGTVFKISPSGSITTLATFNGSNGAYPEGGVIMDSRGNLYGTTSSDGAFYRGTVFKLSPNGPLTTLFNFDGSDGAGPMGNLIMDNSGNLYGTTMDGGSSNQGTVFKLSPTGTLTTLADFSYYTNGAGPAAGLIMDNSGNLYGTTVDGGFHSDGTVFQISPSGSLTTLTGFIPYKGAEPWDSLLMDNSGNLYGTTEGGFVTKGTVFKLSPSGTLTTLASFNGSNGAYPYAGLIVDSNGNLYGTTTEGGFWNQGSVFQLSPNGTLTTLHSFNSFLGDDGLNGGAGRLIADSSGNIYGIGGGSASGGAVFELTGVFQPSGPSSVPEPCTLLLLGQGAAALLGLVWRGRRRLAEKT